MLFHSCDSDGESLSYEFRLIDRDLASLVEIMGIDVEDAVQLIAYSKVLFWNNNVHLYDRILQRFQNTWEKSVLLSKIESRFKKHRQYETKKYNLLIMLNEGVDVSRLKK